MNKLYAGFGRIDVTPMLGIDIIGYFKDRYADGVLDPLEINALALKCDSTTVVFLSIDHLGIDQVLNDIYRKHVAEVTGVPFECVHIHATHTHTGPALVANSDNALTKQYTDYVYNKMADVAVLALADLKPAKMGWAVGTAPNISFVRRFRMKDGSVKTNPGINNPDIVAPIGDVDERVNVLRFDQEGGESLVLVNFADHPDTVGGCTLSCDWPGFLRRTVEKSLDNTKCIFFNGAQGDVNHINVNPTKGDLNDMQWDFDDVYRGYGHARFMGRVVAGGVMQVFDKVNYTDVDTLKSVQKIINVPSNMPDPADMPEAHRINDLHIAGRDSELPYEGMMLTTIVAEAGRMVKLEHGPEAFPMNLCAIQIGNVALITIPGEGFTGIGRALKKAEGWDMVCPLGLTDGYEGYFPMEEAYIEGGYEARSSKFKAGVAEYIIEEGTKLLNSLH